MVVVIFFEIKELYFIYAVFSNRCIYFIISNIFLYFLLLRANSFMNIHRIMLLLNIDYFSKNIILVDFREVYLLYG